MTIDETVRGAIAQFVNQDNDLTEGEKLVAKDLVFEAYNTDDYDFGIGLTLQSVSGSAQIYGESAEAHIMATLWWEGGEHDLKTIVYEFDTKVSVLTFSAGKLQSIDGKAV